MSVIGPFDWNIWLEYLIGILGIECKAETFITVGCLTFSGQPYIRSIGPVRAIAGKDIAMACPYSGYPITSVKWSRGGAPLPPDMRHKNDSEGHLVISDVNPNDAGLYTCTVYAGSGQTASRDISLIVQSSYYSILTYSFRSHLPQIYIHGNSRLLVVLSADNS